MKQQSNIQYDLDFWKNYDRNKVTMNPSSFAMFCLSRMKKGSTMLDVCCGNGRDSQYFKKCGLSVTSFDHETVNLLDKKPGFGFTQTFDHVYCRFVLHCLPEHLEDYVLINSHKVLNTGGLLFIEVRSNKGVIPDFLKDHYRRLIDLRELKNKLRNLNFKVICEFEEAGLSVYNEEDPVLIRIVARKHGNIITRGTEREEKKTYNPIHLEQSIHLLFTTRQIFDDNNISFFLIFGTLLGAYRDGFFIKHDTDIDLGLLEESKEKVMFLIEEGYFALYGMKYTREWHGKGHLKAMQYKNDYIDFWFFKKDGVMYRSGGSYNMKAYQIDKGFSTIKFYGQEFKTVHNIEEYLNRHYPIGDWRIPVLDYHAKY
jgi:hypothetical protein